ncbi:sortase, marine proteobacterial type [Methylophaga sp. 42_25_T18]|nr:sortase, marine proteobacterial type [Methylophaga sp. 42_25_T18]
MKQPITNKFVAVGLMVIACWQIGGGVYIYAKAQLAQYLIASAWNHAETEKRKVKPWAWADMWPVAKLVVAEHDVEQYVLAGTSGESLAFGPGHVFASAAPAEVGNTIIAAHRDTHFSFLQHIQKGEIISISSASGIRRDYVVHDMHVVDKNDVAWLYEHGSDYQLSLVTCYPFNAIQPGGNLRFVVRAISQADISA